MQWKDAQWEYDAATMQYVFRDRNGQEIYYFGLDRCETSAQVLDWLFQIHGKNWGRDSILQLVNYHLKEAARNEATDARVD